MSYAEANMSSRGDGSSISGSGFVPSGGGGGDDSPIGKVTPVYTTKQYSSTSYQLFSKNFYIHTGVPVWKEGNDENAELKFKIGNEIIDKSCFFTYDPTENGISSFENPFIMDDDAEDDDAEDDVAKKYNGVLSNWWSGCEPVCDTLARLIKNGYFYGYPGNHGLGYVFRKNVPRLVFVFCNEWDNEFRRTFSSKKGSTDT